jgi:hypothetical protein
MMDRNFAPFTQVSESEAYSKFSEAHIRGNSQRFLVSTSTTDNAMRRIDEEDPYVNPNLKNDLSQMNISHLSHNESQVYNNTPGQYVEGRPAKHIFSFITNEDYHGLLHHLKSGNDLEMMKM